MLKTLKPPICYVRCRWALPERHLGSQPREPYLARLPHQLQGRCRVAASSARHRGARGGGLGWQCGAGGGPHEGALPAGCWRLQRLLLCLLLGCNACTCLRTPQQLHSPLPLPLLPLPQQAKEALPVMPVRLLDTKSGTWSAVECTAAEGEELPKPRGGHSVREGRRRQPPQGQQQQQDLRGRASIAP